MAASSNAGVSMQLTGSALEQQIAFGPPGLCDYLKAESSRSNFIDDYRLIRSQHASISRWVGSVSVATSLTSTSVFEDDDPLKNSTARSFSSLKRRANSTAQSVPPPKVTNRRKRNPPPFPTTVRGAYILPHGTPEYAHFVLRATYTDLIRVAVFGQPVIDKKKGKSAAARTLIVVLGVELTDNDKTISELRSCKTKAKVETYLKETQKLNEHPEGGIDDLVLTAKDPWKDFQRWLWQFEGDDAYADCLLGLAQCIHEVISKEK
ncbi:hypothetical protein QFC19_004204 [Naganishia cerealis]|uniref:Uncharacterized protein n=1 Tax=Naganishia cerealis TaxID=610337 RepID=A0ACC2VW06_9TREE|nr:hypothetical protein QFC19_004204 [Naganishia cerealis]